MYTNTSKKLLFKFLPAICLYVITALICSCSTNKQIAYFQDVPDSTAVYKINAVPYKEPVIQADDILSVTIQTIDPQNSSVVNQMVSMGSAPPTSSSGRAEPISGFLVDKNGEIELALIGKVRLLGLTTFEARELIRQRASKFYKDPSVQVRYANFKITVIGEVAKPATYTVPNEKVTILDAIGLAGDLTIYGRRENVLLVRDVDGEKQFIRFNLNGSQVFKSPYYYLKQNDIVYVEPNKNKILTTDASRNRFITIAITTTTALIYLLTKIL